MFSTLKGRMTYANVASTVALVLAVVGGGAAAASSLVPRNSVGSAQIINGAVKSVDLRNGGIRASDLNPGPLGVVRGYAWMNSASASAPLTHGYVYNEGGGPVTSTRHGAGNYTVSFDGLDIGAGNVQVTAYGGGTTACKVVGWGPSSATVACFDAAGTPTDSLFSIAMIE